MSKRLVSRIVTAGLLLLAVAGGSYAFANGDALSALSGSGLVASEAPALLGPIDEHGRIGWECRPERAAESADASTAELPKAFK